MSDDEDASPRSSGYAEQVQRYKDYLRDLRTGMPSGISEAFGSALDLLPQIELQRYKGFKAGDDVIPEGGNPEAYRQALEELISEFESGVDELSGEDAEDVMGVSFQDGRKYLMLADGSTVLASARESTETATGDIEANEDSQSVGRLEYSEPESTAAYESAGEQTSAQAEEFDQGDANDISQQLVNVLHGAKERTGSQTAPDQVAQSPIAEWESPDLCVKSKHGKPLWDIYYGHEGVEKIRFYNDTGLFSEGSDDEFTLRNSSNQIVERVKSVAADQLTGNIYYLSLDGQHVTTWLNNGCRLDHYRTADGADKFYLTDSRGENQVEIINVSFDLENDAISYETKDGDEVVTIRSRKLKV